MLSGLTLLLLLPAISPCHAVSLALRTTVHSTLADQIATSESEAFRPIMPVHRHATSTALRKKPRGAGTSLKASFEGERVAFFEPETLPAKPFGQVDTAPPPFAMTHAQLLALLSHTSKDDFDRVKADLTREGVPGVSAIQQTAIVRRVQDASEGHGDHSALMDDLNPLVRADLEQLRARQRGVSQS